MLESSFRYIRRKEVMQMLGVSRSMLEDMVRKGVLPRPYKLGARAVAWRSDELAEAMKNFPRLEDAYVRSGRRSMDSRIVYRRNKVKGCGVVEAHALIKIS